MTKLSFFGVVRRAYFRPPPKDEVKRGALIFVVTGLGLGLCWFLAESGYWQIASIIVLVLWVYLIWAGVRFFRRTSNRIRGEGTDDRTQSVR